MQSGLHCKVECNKEIRRFLFNGTEFASLYEQIKHLFALQGEFVLKYKDEEGDMVTVSTTEELTFAVSCLVPSQALRLEVTLKGPSTPAPVEVKTDKKACKKWGAGAGQCGNRMEWKKQRMQGYLEKLQAMPETDSNREWRSKKIDRLQTKMACLESAQQCQPGGGAGDCGQGWQGKAQNHMQMKQEAIAAKIAQLSSIPPTEGNYEARQKKIEKLKTKLGWLEKRQACMQSGGGKQLSAEEKARFEETKAQMKQIRQNMCNLRAQIHQKKGEWHMAPKENREAISKEICALKEQMRAQKEQMCSLRSHC